MFKPPTYPHLHPCTYSRRWAPFFWLWLYDVCSLNKHKVTIVKKFSRGVANLKIPKLNIRRSIYVTCELAFKFNIIGLLWQYLYDSIYCIFFSIEQSKLYNKCITLAVIRGYKINMKWSSASKLVVKVSIFLPICWVV